jgi:hypothetical protein
MNIGAASQRRTRSTFRSRERVMRGRWRRRGFRCAPPWGPGTPHHFKHRADHDGEAQGQQQAGPRPVFERLPAQAADEEGIARPEDRRDSGRGGETAPRIPDQAAAQCDRGPPAGDEPAADDEAGTEAVKGPLRPGTPARAALPGEDPARDGGTEAAAKQVGDVVAKKGTARRQPDEYGDPGVRAARGGHTERDHRGLAGHQRNEGVERWKQDGEHIRDQ